MWLEFAKADIEMVMKKYNMSKEEAINVLTVQYKAGNIILIIAFVGWIFLLLIYLFG